MEIIIKNPDKNQYGNDKNNIFLAYGKDESYLGSAYVYANMTQSQIEAIPYLIFIDINVEDEMDIKIKDRVKQDLFDQVLKRTIEIRKIRPDLKARVYSGFEYDEIKMNLFLENGFEQDYSMIMKNKIKKDYSYDLPSEVTMSEIDVNDTAQRKDFAELYDSIFISPMDERVIIEQSKQKLFKNLYFYFNEVKCGGCTIFEKDGSGYIETLYVIPELRGKGISKVILQYIFNYFSMHKVFDTQLEVWELNKPAVNLYKSMGYKEVDKHLMFPGKNI